MNLASQSVLEGLNACLDHRGEIFIPELSMTFKVDSSKTKIFACQNPVDEGGGRKSLPKSFLNRFTQVNIVLSARISFCSKPVPLQDSFLAELPSVFTCLAHSYL